MNARGQLNLKRLCSATGTELNEAFWEAMALVPSMLRGPLFSLDRPKMPSGLHQDAQMSYEQLCIFAWMLQIEAKIKEGVRHYPDTVILRNRKYSAYVNVAQRTVSTTPPAHVVCHPKGGIIANPDYVEPSLAIIALLLSTIQPFKPPFPARPSFVQFPTLRPASDFYAHQFSFLSFLDKFSPQERQRQGVKIPDPPRMSLLPPVSNSEEIMGSVNVSRYLFSTNATLVICADFEDWRSKISMLSNLNLVTLARKRDLGSHTYRDIVGADVVLVSHKLITNSRYLGIGNVPPLVYGSRIPRNCYVKRYLLEILREKDPLSTIAPVLDHFKWHRIVVPYSIQATCGLGSLHSDYLWLLAPNFQSNRLSASAHSLLGFDKSMEYLLHSDFVYKSL
eukprot:Phypoly_transcript_07187.p1 GENE.Phypoly_transcript_07187~~Phypoly_transcript_07187.p1  ORF type:complete len:393 (+),score=36.27 Phypoly_transcript_07187:394-1572(+)